ncbi:endo-1,3(4)-beta-glucanase chain A [Coprinopsis sp. MPI-PUGE-AT-0042]|nr:endo-1,3(4)-beta-glucanase chain A [Coprinopsis sp. MPI-PUGE-AT-0042]
MTTLAISHGVAWLFLVYTIVFVNAAGYQLQDRYSGFRFFDEWIWESFQDPTHGRVNYVDIETAISKNLSYATDRKFIMRADHWSKTSPFSRGRDSVRIRSKAAWGDSLLVLDLEHMPEGCATWPAFWTLSENGPWPAGGEIDILEGVNLNNQNAAALHTSGACSMAPHRSQTGSAIAMDCDGLANGNQGCGTSFSKANSYGIELNRERGGWYVMQRSATEGINIWFWSRSDSTVPLSVKYGGERVDIGPSWGLPEASFTFETCSYLDHFDNHQVVFDLTFCGDWAGSAFELSGCGPMKCEDYVDQNPWAFENAFWEINSLRVYRPLPEYNSRQGYFEFPIDCVRLIDKLRPDLTLPDSEDTWEKVAKALVAVKQACEERRFDDASEVAHAVKTLNSSMVTAMNSERTRLCLSALDLVDAVAVACEVKFEPLISVFLPSLLALCGRTNKVILNKTRKCITNIVEVTQIASTLSYFLPPLSEKSVTIRLVAVEGALACVKCSNPPDLEKESRASEIESIIRKAARDASADIRKVGREIFTAYKILLPDRVERFTAPLTPTIKKYLEIKASAAPIKTTALARVKSMSALSTSRPEPSTKATATHTRVPSVSTSTSTAAKEPQRAAPVARERVQRPATTTATGPVRPALSTNQPRKLVSQTGAAGPLRVIPRPASTEPPRSNALRRGPPSTTLTTRPGLSSSGSQRLDSSGPRRIPLPSSSQSQAQASTTRPTLTRPTSQQGHRAPAVKPVRPVVVARTVKPEPKGAVVPALRSKTPTERVPRVRAGLTEPTASQLAKMKPKVAPLAKPVGKPTAKAPAKKAKEAAVLRDGAPRSNSGETLRATAKKEEPLKLEDLAVPDEASNPVAEEQVVEAEAEVQEEAAEEDEHEEEGEPRAQGLPSIAEPQDEVSESESDVPMIRLPTDGQGTPDPITPPQATHLGVAWNANDAKTPISALLSSIQQGFEFSPASPLSPPMGYANHHAEPVTLF